MSSKPINEILADNLRQLMDRCELKQPALATLSGVKQTTISLYLSPARRLTGKSGKASSAKLTEVAMLAKALCVEPWELLKEGGAAGQQQRTGLTPMAEHLAGIFDWLQDPIQRNVVRNITTQAVLARWKPSDALGVDPGQLEAAQLLLPIDKPSATAPSKKPRA